jgi:3',5'-cyclic AMP phosphodiesterase CpdA
MRTIAHISDIHFGRIRPGILRALRTRISELSPDLVVLSGDVTQRARSHQFAEALSYLATIESPLLVVPGNHDIPLHNLMRRLLRPYSRYRRFFGRELNPAFINEEMMVLGLNTARGYVWKSGDLASSQLALVARSFQTASEPSPQGFAPWKIVAMHHPFLLPGSSRVQRMRRGLRAFAQAGVEIVLSGHYHEFFAIPLAVQTSDGARTVLQAMTGTAASSRTRKTPNTFTFLELNGDTARFTPQTYEENAFVANSAWRYRRGEGLLEGPAAIS